MVLTELSKPAVQNAYQENEILTARPEELILMLYNGAIRFINQGRACLEEKKWNDMGWNLIRAQKVVHYLDLCLNLEKGENLAKNLDSLYRFILGRIALGNSQQNQEYLDEALGLLRTLRDAWKEGVVNANDAD